VSPDPVGWASTAILLATVGCQTFKQWEQPSTEGVSHWFFVGQSAASMGFVVYSSLLGNAVFVVSNAFLLLIAIAGQILFVRNRHRQRASGASACG
jgi:MtN3 and saliva related transmembrane protein